MPNPVVHWEIMAKDGKKAQEFYKALFGWKVDANNPMNYGLVDTQAKAGINGGILATHEGMPQMVTVYVEVDDLGAYLKKAAKLGGRTIVPVTEVPGMVTFAVFVDPQGIAMGLVKSDARSKPAAAPKRAPRAKPKTKR